MIKYCVVFIFYCEFLITPVFATNPTSIPISHPIYPYLERMEALGHVENLLDGIRPYSRVKVAGILAELDKKRDKLTSISA